MSGIRIALVIAGVLALVGGGTALAEKSAGPTQRGAALIADVKEHLGSNTPADLDQHVTDFVNGNLPARTGRVGFGRQQRFPGLEVVTSYLGISNSDLLAQLRAGKTLAQIANATPGKSASGLIAALVADAQQRFGSKVPSDLEQRITDLVIGVHVNARPRHGAFFRPNGSNI